MDQHVDQAGAVSKLVDILMNADSVLNVGAAAGRTFISECEMKM